MPNLEDLTLAELKNLAKENNVKNISKVCTGVKMVELNGIEIENKILLDGSGKIFNVEAKM